jgi:hypothetical protein
MDRYVGRQAGRERDRQKDPIKSGGEIKACVRETVKLY